MPQLDIFTIVNEIIVITIIFVPAMLYFRFFVYPYWDLFLRVRIYRQNIIFKAIRTKILNGWVKFTVCKLKTNNLDTFLQFNYYEGPEEIKDFQIRITDYIQ